MLVSTAEFGGFRASVNRDGSKVAYEAAEQIYVWDDGTTDNHLNFQVSGTVTAEVHQRARDRRRRWRRQRRNSTSSSSRPMHRISTTRPTAS